jgi:hypothetical protein
MKAFPNPHAFNAESAQLGMDLRDYFAAKAIQAFLTHDPIMLELRKAEVVKDLAKGAYQMADAMMQAREGKR